MRVVRFIFGGWVGVGPKPHSRLNLDAVFRVARFVSQADTHIFGGIYRQPSKAGRRIAVVAIPQTAALAGIWVAPDNVVRSPIPKLNNKVAAHCVNLHRLVPSSRSGHPVPMTKDLRHNVVSGNRKSVGKANYFGGAIKGLNW